MLQIIIIMLKCRAGIVRRIYKDVIFDTSPVAGIVRRIDIDTLYLPGEFALQRFQRQQIIPMDQHILRLRVGGSVGKLRIFNQ